MAENAPVTAENPTPGNETSNNQTDQNNQTANEENKNNIDFTQLWQDNSGSETSANNTNATSAGNNDTGEKPKTQQDLVDEYVKQFSGPEFTFTDEEREQISRGDYSPMQAKYQTAMQNVAGTILGDSVRIAEAAAQRAVDAAVGKANTDRENAQLIGAMHNDLPWTNNPFVSPIAESILGKIQETQPGISNSDAIGHVKRAFKYMQETLGDELLPEETRQRLQKAPDDSVQDGSTFGVDDTGAPRMFKNWTEFLSSPKQ